MNYDQAAFLVCALTGTGAAINWLRIRLKERALKRRQAETAADCRAARQRGDTREQGRLAKQASALTVERLKMEMGR